MSGQILQLPDNNMIGLTLCSIITDHSPAPVRCAEHNNQCRVSDDGRSVRLAIEPRRIALLFGPIHGGGHVCHSTDYSVSAQSISASGQIPLH